MFKHIIVRLITTIIFIYGVIVFTGAVSGSTNVIDPLENFKGGASIIKKEKLDWLYVKNLQQLEDVIAKSSKPIMVDFWATWCVSCKELDNITFKDSRVKAELSKFQLVKVDVTKNTDCALVTTMDNKGRKFFFSLGTSNIASMSFLSEQEKLE